MVRAVLGAFLGALAAAATLVAITTSAPRIALEMGQDLPRSVASGFYSAERHGDETFAWTSPLATLRLRQLDRQSAWRCDVRMRGARPAGTPPAQVTVAVDGISVARRTLGPEYEHVAVDIPPRGPSLVTLTLATTPAFVPSSDPRELGVQVDGIACAPTSPAWLVWPPRDALIQAMLAGAAVGALAGLLLASVTAAVVTVLLFGCALAWALGSGVAAYTPAYLGWIAPMAISVAAPLIVLAAWRGRVWHPAARFVLLFSACALLLKLLALLHPSKDLVDAVFHAHRLEWVRDGRYYFTQPMPGGVQFPYAIGLYVTSLPFAALTRDYVALLRIVTVVFEAAAGALLYLAVSRAWNDRLAGAAAVVLYHLAPLPYVVVGNANLTYAFGQATAVMAMSLATILPFRLPRLAAGTLLFGITSLALLSHVGVFPMLAVALVALSVMYWWTGRERFRSAGGVVLAATLLAALFAVAVYYAHFPEVYSTLDRVSTARADASAASPDVAPMGVSVRATRTASLAIGAFGWPLLLLALGGVWLVARGGGDPLTPALASWGVSLVGFVLFRVAAPVDPRLQRYADEFVERVYYATLPAVAILAGAAVAWCWRRGAVARLLAACLLVAAVSIGIDHWMQWIG